MKYIFSILLSVTFFFAQADTKFVAAKTGLILRELPNATSIEVERIPYGTSITTTNMATETPEIVVNNIKGQWLKTSYKGKTGYVASCYLFNVAPPKANTKTLKDYFNQLSVVLSTVKKKSPNEGRDDYFDINKTLYKNSFEIHAATFYEANEEAYFLVDFTIEQAFILCKLIEETQPALANIDAFPIKAIKSKDEKSGNDYLLELKKYGEEGGVYDLHIEYYKEIFNFLDIKMVAGQMVISVGGGV